MFEIVLALHIIFVVTWFAGLFYMPRLLIYDVEANQKTEPEKTILQTQFRIMQSRLWYGITWPSMILTIIFGAWLTYLRWSFFPQWLVVKLCFVAGLIAYHFLTGSIFKKINKGTNTWTSSHLRLWNEVATIFLFCIVFIVVLKTILGLLWGLTGILALAILLMAGFKIYKNFRKNTLKG